MEKVLEFTAQGNAIISELLKISELIPDEFKISEVNKKYNEILVDFQYFKQMENFDKKIESNSQLSDLDESLRDNYSRILIRFYSAFESVFEYATEFNIFISQLNAGDYIQESLESIFQDPEGCQLICEAVYLYAVMLIILDIYIPGEVREKLLVAYYRYHSQNSDTSVDDICKFCRSTGYLPSNSMTEMIHFQPHTVSKGYPENFFSRVKLDETLISMTIETLKTEDIYHQMQKFPSPEHRTIALASQSSMLFLCLYFQPEILTNQNSRMREICDKFFYNNWVISLYMGLTVNLIDAWDGYKAAKNALTNILQPQMIKEIATNNEKTLKKMLENTKGLLKDGILVESFLMKNLQKIIKIIRECNFCIRWWILNHSSSVITKKSKVYYDYVKEAIESKDFDDQLYELILNLSQLELTVREIVKDMLENKDEKWKKYKADIDEVLKELILLFSKGDTTVLKVEKNEHLTAWFEEMSKQIDSLDLQQKLRTVEKKLVQIIQALGEVQDYHNIQTNAYAKQRTDDILQNLSNMIHLMNIKDSILVDLQAIGDFNYAWYLIDEYTEQFHKSIQKSPNILIRLRALFIKISSALEIPLLRINQCGGSEELVSIVSYYSNALVKYVRKIVQIIPHSIFNLLKSIIEIQTNNLKELPEKLDKDKIREYAQLDERFKIAKLTFSISVFTDGIMAMKKTLVGVIELDPKLLLEDGIRMELINSVSKAFNQNLQFNNKAKNQKELLVVENLTKLSNIMDGYRRSFEYIQDYLNINGLKIWQEEVMRLIYFNVEQECNSFMKKKIQFSRYQSDAIPIPVYPVNLNDNSVTFIGRLGRELLRITDPKTSIYVDLLTSWFDAKSHQELIDLKFTEKINESIEIYGLVGIDKLFSYMISNELETIHKNLLKTTLKEKQWIDFFKKFRDDLTLRKNNGGKTADTSFENPYKKYQSFISKTSKSLPNILTSVLGIGQKQIWKIHIAHLLTTSSRMNCKNLSDRLITFNDALLYELKSNELDNTKPKPSSQLLLSLNKYLEVVGQYEPIEKVYVKMAKNSNEFLTFLVILTLTHLNKLAFGEKLMMYNKAIGGYAIGIAKQRKILIDLINSGKFIDGHVFLLGMVTLMRQFHENNYIEDFIKLLGECVLEMIEYNLSSKAELNLEILNGIDLLERLVKLTATPKIILENIIPSGLLDQKDYLLTIVNTN